MLNQEPQVANEAPAGAPVLALTDNAAAKVLLTAEAIATVEPKQHQPMTDQRGGEGLAGAAEGVRSFARRGRPVAGRPAGDAGPAVRFPGRGHRAPAAAHRAAGRAHCLPGRAQRRAGLLAQPACRRGARRRRAVGADRRIELLRAGGGGGDLAVRPEFRRGAGHRGGRAGRGAGDAVAGGPGQCLAACTFRG